MNAIIRHLTSGEHFLATLDDSGDATRLSAALPIVQTLGEDWRESNATSADWERFEDADLEPWEDEADRWTADRFIVLHTFD